MDHNYTVDLDELQALTRRIDDFAFFVRECLLAADASATSLPTVWTGPAADAFQVAYRDWGRSAETLATDISALAASTKSACETYSAAFEGNSSMLLQGRP